MKPLAWPASLPGCPRCLRLARFIAYGSAGLCIDCHSESLRYAERARWEYVFTRLTNLHYNKRRGKPGNFAYLLVKDFGFTSLAKWLGNPSELKAWIDGDQSPSPLQLLRLANASGRERHIWKGQKRALVPSIDSFATLGWGSDSLTEPEYL